MICLYKYNNDMICHESCKDGTFCERHKDTYQARIKLRLLNTNSFYTLLHNNEAYAIIDNNRLLPLGEKEIKIIESRGITIKDSVKQFVMGSDEPEVNLCDTFLAL